MAPDSSPPFNDCPRLAKEAIGMDVSYEKQTVDNPNPIARFAHRTRLKKSKRLLMPFLGDSAVLLDYGCGQGKFLHDIAVDIKEQRPGVALLGYDPYQSAQYDDFRIVSDPTAIAAQSVTILTCLEVCEHLTDSETQEFVDFALHALAPNGRMLVTVPIMMGPAVLLKELSRSILFRRRPDMTGSELFKAAFLGIPARRADDIKASHRGFDWRATRRTLLESFRCVNIEFSPLPFKSPYWQSQVLMLFEKA
jgi:2-polyprenyl-3-methyl-5-hydroxy-6-metoxy-1,4-benzoquinol methylase